MSHSLPSIIRPGSMSAMTSVKSLSRRKKAAILVTHDISEAISMADRVIILSSRPAIIRKIVPIHFNLENRTPMSSRNAPDFKSYFNLIWKELNHDA